MKTKNNVQKTFLRTIAVIVSFVLLSLTVTAQGYWKQLLINTGFNQIATALVGHHTTTPTEKSQAGKNGNFDYFYDVTKIRAGLEENIFLNVVDMPEHTLELEPWMLDVDLWNN